MGKATVPPDVGEEDIEEEPKEEVEEEERIESKGNISTEVNVILERMRTQIKALNEVRETNNERFLRISEQVGEIRSMVVETEKNMKDIEVKATMASDLVKEVQPEKLSEDVTKIDAKVEALKAKIEAEKSINDSIIEELKNIKRQMSLFKGIDAIFKLDEDIKKELINIQKIKAITEGHANKVEQIFITVQKNFSDFRNLESNTENALALASDLQKEVNNLKLTLQTVPTKKDFNSLSKAIDTNANFVNKYLKDIKKNKDLITLLKVIEERLSELIQDSKNDISVLRKGNEKTNKNVDEVYAILKKLTEKVNKKVPDKEIKRIKEELGMHAKELNELLKLVGMIEEKVVKKA